jgi:hypothetical protein
MSNSPNVNLDNLSDEQIDAQFDAQIDAHIDATTGSDSSPSVHSPTFSQSVHNPTFSPSHTSSVNPSHTPYVSPSHSPSTLLPISSDRSNNDELQHLRKKNDELQRKLEIASAPKLSPAEIDAFMKEANQNYATYKNAQASTEYYNQRAKQREKSGYVDPFFTRPTIAFVNSVPTGNAMCSQINSRSSFTGVHIMSGSRSNVAVGMIGVYGSR